MRKNNEKQKMVSFNKLLTSLFFNVKPRALRKATGHNYDKISKIQCGDDPALERSVDLLINLITFECEHYQRKVDNSIIIKFLIDSIHDLVPEHLQTISHGGHGVNEVYTLFKCIKDVGLDKMVEVAKSDMLKNKDDDEKIH